MRKKSKCKNNCRLQNIIIIILFLLFIGLLIFVLMNQMNEYYQQTSPLLMEIREKLENFADNPSEYETIQKLKFFQGKKSYTINKKKVYLCLYDEYGKPYNMNMLMYVALHELAHVFCDEIGHTPKFHRIFKEFLIRAEQKGIYDSTIPILKNYCGHN